MTSILAIFFALVCGLLAFGLVVQTRQWNAILRKIDWGNTILGYGLAAWLTVAAAVLSIIAWARLTP